MCLNKKIRKYAIFVTLCLIFVLTMIFAFRESKKAYAAEGATFAEQVETEKVPIKSVNLIANTSGQVKPGDEVNLRVELTPIYAIETVSKIEYLIIDGNGYVTQRDYIFVVKEDAIIGGNISVVAIVDGVESQTLSFTITAIPVSQIVLLNEETKIQQNRTLQIKSEVLPYDATNKRTRAIITEGAEYARITQGGLITVENNLPAGDLSITVRFESIADASVYVEKSFDLYVPTRSLYIETTNQDPIPGENITLHAITDEKASTCDSEFFVKDQDLKYVKSLSGNQLILSDTIEDFNPSVTVYYMRDGITAEKKIDIYIPTTGIEFVAPISTIKQGGMEQFQIETTPVNATLKNLIYKLGDYDNASITKDGLFSAYILPERTNETVEIIAEIDGIINSTIVTILRPNVILTANRYAPETSSKTSQSVTLTTEVDDVVVTENLNYIIKSGDNYVEGGAIIGDTFSIVRDIVDFNPEITLTVTYKDWESNTIIIRPTILVESIEINNSLENVEQQRTYSFAGSAYPLNATKADDPLGYSVNVHSDIATIDSSTGILSISATAPIGTNITITVNGPDGAFGFHTVTVVTVYAAEMRLDKVVNQREEEILNNAVVYPGDRLSFSASFPEPFNITEAQKTYTVEFYRGSDIAVFSGNTVTIKSQEQISDLNPYITFRVFSVQGQETLEKFFTVYVHIRVTDIEYNQLKTQVAEGSIVSLSSIVEAYVMPNNSTVRNVDFSVSGHAEKRGNFVYVNDNVTSGSLTFTVTLSAEDICIPINFGIYVKAENLDIKADIYNPLTRIDADLCDTVTVTVIKDIVATDGAILSITNGAELIVGNYVNCSAIPIEFNNIGEGIFSFTVKSSANIRADKLIRLSVSQGELSRQIDILIDKPIESLTVTTGKTDGSKLLVTRGLATKLDISFTQYASITDKWTVDIPEITYSFNRSNAVFTTPQSAEAGRTYVAKFTTHDTLNKTFEIVFIVDKLDAKKFTFVNGSNNSSSNPYVVDSDGVAIASTNPQLWVGRSTDIVLTYNGVSFENYGLKINSAGFVSGGDYATIIIQSNNKVRLSINGEASGKVSVQPKITIKDGAEPYTVQLPSIAVFRPMNGTPTLINGSITSTPTQLKLGVGTFDTTATAYKTDSTCGLGNLVFYGSGLTGVSVTNSGSLNITESARGTQRILLKTLYPDGRYTQTYNGNGVYKELELSPTIHIISLDKQGGSGGPDTIVAVNNLTSKLSNIPTRPGYKFGGYYTSANGGGKQYYDASGQLKVEHSSYSSTTKLYAKWTGYTFKVTFYYYNDVGGCNPVQYTNGKNGGTSVTCTYGTAYQIPNYDISGGDSKFVCWKLGGVQVSTTKRITVNANTMGGNVPTSDGSLSLKYIGYCTWSSESCIAGNTLVTLADRTQKPVSELNGTESLLVWNLQTGAFDVAPVFFVATHKADEYNVTELLFDDGTSIEIIGRHGFWDYTSNRFVYIESDNVDDFLGHYFAKDVGSELRKICLIDAHKYARNEMAYSPHAYAHLAFFANGILNVPNNTDFLVNFEEFDNDTIKYNSDALANDIAKYGLLSPEDLNGLVPAEFFYGMNAQYVSIAIGRGIITMDDLVKFVEAFSEYVL